MTRRAKIAEELEEIASGWDGDPFQYREQISRLYVSPAAMLALMEWYEAEHRKRGCGYSTSRFCEWSVRRALNCRSPRILRRAAKAIRAGV